ncbi:unnamed protein product [Polarella glacialis]|uniref:Uncharacterized protein n=1 Tax=Polarella glacialis TaxID=89957 RepID=A0A813HBC7_POLGL|nr:unnamed protein product [Polarella glacialis]
MACPAWPQLLHLRRCPPLSPMSAAGLSLGLTSRPEGFGKLALHGGPRRSRSMAPVLSHTWAPCHSRPQRVHRDLEVLGAGLRRTELGARLGDGKPFRPTLRQERSF